MARSRFHLRSIRLRLVLLIGVLAAVLAAPLVLWLPGRIEALVRAWAESRSVAVATLLASASRAALEFDDPDAAQRVLAPLASTPDARWGVLARPDGTPLARWGAPPSEPGRCERASPCVTYQEGAMEVVAPVQPRVGAAGRLAVGFGLEELRTRQREVRLLLAGLAGLVLAVGLGGALAIGSVVAGPIRRMTLLATRIADGDATAQGSFETRRTDELGALASAFDRMLRRLYLHQAALTRTNAELADRLAELRRTQDQLVRADRQMALGRLASGVGHEINNPLAWMSGNLEFAAGQLEEWTRALAAEGRAPPESVRDVANAIDDTRRGADRIRRIVRGLKNLSRGQDDDDRAPVQVAAVLDAAIEMAAHETRPRARLVRDYGDAPLVLASEVRLSQVFLNLLVNAAQAIPEGAPDRHEVVARVGADPRGWAVVEVSDTGCGMSEEVRAQLFSPFFTTKPAGSGTGLGLSISHGIVTGLGGRIEVETAPGQGSTFRVVLPPIDTPPLAAQEPA